MKAEFQRSVVGRVDGGGSRERVRPGLHVIVVGCAGDDGGPVFAKGTGCGSCGTWRLNPFSRTGVEE
ncbi:hypothetical protein HYQ46_007017 [Verticillium longisporum]|nr:hypothetical protein HYQ46_007017 [Verticillium longisporum]